MSRPRAYLAGVGDVNDPITWSGTPYYFLQAARPVGLLDEGLALSVAGQNWRVRRWLWNGWQVARGRGKGGYQYSSAFLEKLWQPVTPRLLDQRVVNCFQLYPPSVVAQPRIGKTFYIDMTLRQLFDDYEQRKVIGKGVATDALRREKEGYQAAEWVVCHSRWPAESVARDYDIDPSRVKVVVPGANVDREVYQAWERHASLRPRQRAGEPLRLIFIGKYWFRKGLDRLLEAVQFAQRGGVPIALSVMGCPREDVPAHLRDVENVRWLGFVDKRHDTRRFFDLVSAADLGCLLSRAEAGGMALREYHALGLVVMGPDVGGAPEHLLSDAGRAFAPSDPPHVIAGWLKHLHTYPEEWERLRERAWQRRHESLWDESVKQWHAFWSGGV